MKISAINFTSIKKANASLNQAVKYLSKNGDRNSIIETLDNEDNTIYILDGDDAKKALDSRNRAMENISQAIAQYNTEEPAPSIVTKNIKNHYNFVKKMIESCPDIKEIDIEI